jgi:cell division transport system permease protein
VPVSVDYVAKETASNLWRNRLMTIAAMLTVAVSLSLVGAAMLLRQGASNASQIWQGETQVRVWMQPTAPPSEIKAIGIELKQVPYVRQPCVYAGKATNYAEAKHLLSPDVFSQLNQSDLPTYFGCTPTQPQDVVQVQDRFQGQPGVRIVTAPLQQIHSEEVTVGALKWTFIVLALILLISATVLILNTIRMAIFARRREVSVMKLVGATNWFIRIPFMSEGLIEGLFGAGVAVGVVTALHVVLDHFGQTPGTVLSDIRVSGWDVFWIDVILAIIGIVIGSGGSALAIGRFLDV